MVQDEQEKWDIVISLGRFVPVGSGRGMAV